MSRALELIKKGELVEAELTLEQAIAADPRNIDAYKKYAALLLKQRKFGESERVLKLGLAHNPFEPQLKAYMAIHYCWAGKPQKGLEIFKKVEDNISNRAVMQFLVGECLMYNGRYASAAKTLGKTLRSGSAKKHAALQRALRLRYASALLETNRLKDAEREIAQLPHTEKPRPEVLSLEAELLLRKGRCKTALERYGQLSGLGTERPIGVARAHVCLRQYRKAQVELQRYLRTQRAYTEQHLSGKLRYPDLRALRKSSRAALILGDVLVKRRELSKALKRYALARKLGYDAETVDWRSAKIHFRQGHYKRCLTALDTLLGKKKPSREVLRLALRSAARSGNKEKAIALGERLLRQGKPTAQDRLLAGITHKAAGAYPRAIALLSQAFAADSRSRSIQRELGHCYLLQSKRDTVTGKTPAAIAQLEKLQQIPAYRNSQAADTNLALLYLDSSKPRPALRHAQALLRRDSNDRRAMWLSGRAQLALKQPAKAWRWYQEYLKRSGKKRSPLDAQVRIEAGVALAQLKKMSAAAEQTRQAIADETSTPDVAARNLARMEALDAAGQLRRKRTATAQLRLTATVESLQLLSEDEQAAILGRLFVAALGGGKLGAARQLIKSRSAHIVASLRPPLRAAGEPLLTALLGIHGSKPKRKYQAARRLITLARRMNASEATLLRTTAVQASHQAAYAQLRQGDATRALRWLKATARTLPSPDPTLTHNLAVASYRARRTAQAVTALGAVAEAMPLAYCNLAVVKQNGGQPRKAFDLFKTCRQRGGDYPRLAAILALQEYLFGS